MRRKGRVLITLYIVAIILLQVYPVSHYKKIGVNNSKKSNKMKSEIDVVTANITSITWNNID